MKRDLQDEVSSARKQYLHVIAYPCDKCRGPVVAGSLAIRETVIAKETDVMRLGGICLACGHRQDLPTSPNIAQQFPPVQWK